MDHIIDTNVLLVASARHPISPFRDCDHVPVEQQQTVLDWLMEFRKDGQRQIVLDLSCKILDEYHNKLTRGQDLGSLVVMEKMQLGQVRFVKVVYDQHGHGCLPPVLEKVVHDRSDRKFVAAAMIDLSNGDESTIINAVDTDWYAWETALKRAGITVIHLNDGLGTQTQGLAKPKARSKTKR